MAHRHRLGWSLPVQVTTENERLLRLYYMRAVQASWTDLRRARPGRPAQPCACIRCYLLVNFPCVILLLNNTNN